MLIIMQKQVFENSGLIRFKTYYETNETKIQKFDIILIRDLMHGFSNLY